MYVCPKCDSKNIVKGGKAIRKGGRVQALHCKDCGYRGLESKFSEIEATEETIEE
jgi:transposase-like protein